MLTCRLQDIVACLTLALGALIPTGQGLAQQGQSFTCTLPDDPRGQTRSAHARIVGGTNADWRDWPWQVAVRAGSDLCGGSIIHPQWVLTAAHCFGENVSERDIRIWHGGNRIGRGGQAHDIAAIFFHPGWRRPTMENDIALLRLARPMQNLPRGAIVQLQTQATERVFTPTNTCSVVTGWGQTRFGDHPPSQLLQQVDVPVIDLETCRQAYQGRAPAPIHDTNICAGYAHGTRDSCQGDSGGPLVVPDPNVPMGWTQTGIVSWGIGCAEPESYGVYTRVAPFIPWIQSTVADN